MEKKNCTEWLISLILRLAISSLFIATATAKFTGGLGGVVQYFHMAFKDSWLPMWLVSLQAHLIPWAEALIPIWLLTGYKLKAGWVFTALVLVSLSFGMAVLGKFDIASHNYIYVLIACAGLYFSKYDFCCLGGKSKCCCGDKKE